MDSVIDTLPGGSALWLAAAAGLLGFAAGWLIERSHFCTMGAISDAYLFGSGRRLRAWALAVATALVATQTLAAAGVVPLAQTFYLAPRLEPLALLVGGLLFGIGMVLAGGCASRNLVRLGAGSLKALVVVLVMAVTAFATTAGSLVWPATALRGLAAWTFDAPTQSLGGLLAASGLAGLGQAAAARLDLGLALGLATGLLAWAYRDPAFRRSWPDQQVGLGLGLLVACGFLVTGRLLHDPFEPPAVVSLSYVAPTARALLWTMTGNGAWPGFGAALAFGTILGAAGSAWRGRRLRIETFSGSDDMIRHVVGGGLMGFGGMLALGCTIGQGLTGLATLAMGSMVAMAGIVAGALLALRRLEQGSWRRALAIGGGLRRNAVERR